ncbi:MAG: ferrous iron transporter B [Candidatus Kapaibacterium sp.]|nr:MAG: ferrous iron transporter B [Candidatus Kapabacteria bacterium]
MQPRTIALVGTPNSGKSTIFNALTGLRQKVGNFSGVTVEAKTGSIRLAEQPTAQPSSPTDSTTTNARQTHVQCIDLPGLYSLNPKTPDEKISVEILRGEHSRYAQPDAVVFVMEGVNLEKSLFLYAQYAALKIPTIVAVTMIDSIQASGGVFDDIEMAHALGVEVCGIVGHKGIGIEDIRHAIAANDFRPPEAALQGLLSDISSELPRSTPHPEQESIEQQHEWARQIASDVARIPEHDALTLTLDAIFLHPLWGPLVFLAVMLLFFQAIFTWATPAMDGIDALFAALGDQITTLMPAGIVQDFVVNGVIAGVGSVIKFLPQILILTLVITLLEDVGYLARGAFLVDRAMGAFGLQGRAFVPLLSSFACAIPGMMSARIIASEKDRLTTILIAPLMPCSARLPIYVLMITAFVPSVFLAGILNVQGLVLMGLYALGGVSGLLAAKVLKSTAFHGSKLPFLMELPPYRFPTWKGLLLTLFHRTKQFLTSAGTTILLLSVLLWGLGAFPQAQISSGTEPIRAKQIQLEQSALGRIGKAIEPVFAPLGFDWKVTVGVLGSFAAREVFVSVMGQVYSVDIAESDEQLRTILQRTISFPAAISILVFYVYALQCMSTIAVMKRETGSWKYPAFAFSYTLVLAYTASLLVYQVCRVLWQ